MHFSDKRRINRRKSIASSLLSTSIIALLVTAPLTAVSENLIINGGFEEPDLAALGIVNVEGNGWTTFFGVNAPENHCSDSFSSPCYPDIDSKDTAVPGWSVYWSDGTYGRLEIQRGFIGNNFPYVGNQKAELDSHHRATPHDPSLDHNVTLVQEIRTCPRAPYTLSYSWKPRTLTVDDSDMLVLIDDQELVAHTNVDDRWTPDAHNFIAKDGGLSTIAFASLGTATTLGMLLDNVSVHGQDGSDAAACEQVAVCGTKPAALELLYNGFSDSDFFTQDTSEVEIQTFTADPFPNVVFISVYDHLFGKANAATLFSGEVIRGDTLTFSGTKGRKKLIPPKITIEIHDTSDGSLLQRISFHTSCSQPLNIGDQFGGIAIFGFTP